MSVRMYACLSLLLQVWFTSTFLRVVCNYMFLTESFRTKIIPNSHIITRFPIEPLFRTQYLCTKGFFWLIQLLSTFLSFSIIYLYIMKFVENRRGCVISCRSSLIVLFDLFAFNLEAFHVIIIIILFEILWRTCWKTAIWRRTECFLFARNSMEFFL